MEATPYSINWHTCSIFGMHHRRASFEGYPQGPLVAPSDVAVILDVSSAPKRKHLTSEVAANNEYVYMEFVRSPLEIQLCMEIEVLVKMKYRLEFVRHHYGTERQKWCQLMLLIDILLSYFGDLVGMKSRAPYSV